MGTFTTVLIENYNLNKTSGENTAAIEAWIGISQDIPPIIVAVLAGLLQQIFGARMLLIVSAVPSLLSWLVVAVSSPRSLVPILLSRMFAGLASGLLTGNSYLADLASDNNRSSLKMVEVSAVQCSEVQRSDFIQRKTTTVFSVLPPMKIQKSYFQAFHNFCIF